MEISGLHCSAMQVAGGSALKAVREQSNGAKALIEPLRAQLHCDEALGRHVDLDFAM